MVRASTFTSYINAELPASAEAAWSRFEQRATTAYGNVARAAQAASNAAAGINGRGTPARGVDRNAAASRATADANARAERAAAAAARSVEAHGRAADRAARQNNAYSRSLNAVSTSLNIVQGPLGPIAGRIAALSRGLADLTGFRAGLAGVAGSLFLLGSMGNTYTQIRGQIAAAYESQTDFNRAMEDISGIAARARVGIQTVTGLYIRLGQAADTAGISAERAARVTEIAAKAAALSGGARASQEAALVQFTQAFGANFKAGGQELQSILEQANQLAVAIAKGLGVGVSQLKVLGEQGKLSAEVVAQALERSAGDIEARFARMPVTLAQATTNFGNQLLLMVGGIDQAIGLTGTLASIITATANSMQFLASAAAGVAVGFAAIKMGAFIASMATAINQQRVMYAAVTQLGIRRQQVAAASVAQHAREVAATEAEQQQIRETIVLLQTQAATARSGRTVADNPTQRIAWIEAEKEALRRLAIERARLIVLSDANASAAARLAAAQAALTTATQNVANRTSLLSRAVSNIIGSFNLWGIAIAAATTALIWLATRSSYTEEVLSTLSSEMRSTAENALQLAQANRAVAASMYEIARAAGKKAEREARETFEGTRGELAGRFRQVAAGFTSPGAGQGREFAAVSQDLYRMADGIEKGTVSLDQALAKARALEKKYPDYFGAERTLGFRFPGTTGTRVQDIEENAIAMFAAQQNLNKALADQADIEKEIKRQQEPIKLDGKTSVSTGSLRTNAAADALDSGTSAIRAAGIRRRQAYDELDKSLNVVNGAVPAGTAEDYRMKAADIERAYNNEVNGIKAAAAARTQAAQQARYNARVEKADAREGIEDRLGQGLLALEQNKPKMNVDEYNEARLKLLRTYDAEIQALDETSAHSSKATAQMIRDARNLQAAAAKSGDRRSGILDQWSEEPKAIVRARAQIEDLNRMVDTLVDGVAEISKENPLGTGLYTQAMADADARRIMDGVVRPMREAKDQHQQFLELATLRLNGLDAEANALERALDIQERQGALSREEFQILVDQENQQQAINDTLTERGRLTQAIQATVGQTRDAFESLLTDLPTKGGDAVKQFIGTMRQQVTNLWAKRVTEWLFAGADGKMRQMLQGRGGVEQAYAFLANHTVKTGNSLDTVAQAAADCAKALEGLTQSASNPVQDPAGPAAGSLGLFGPAGGPAAGPGKSFASKMMGLFQDAASDIVVTGQKRQPKTPVNVPTDPSTGLPTKVYSGIFQGFGEKMDSLFGSRFFKGIGGAVGTAFEGAGQGMMSSGIAGMLGIKQSNTGAAIGGAIGNFIPGLPPGVGSAIGGLLGGTIGGLFMKPNSGKASISMNQYGEVVGGQGSGRGKDAIAGATGAAKSISEAINQITGQLGATITNLPGITVGSWNDRARVALTNTTKDLHSKNFGSDVLKDFGDDQQAAIEYAIKYVIGNAVISGISQASQNIFKSGQDLQQAIMKATAIESIPKRLMQRLDPTRYAVTELNNEFTKLIAYLKEGGATAEQFADAQKLYDLERADAIKQATDQAVGALDQFMKDMMGGANSPLNKRTVYSNAQTELSRLAAEVNAGKVVDQNELLTAVKNFQDASRALNGSSQEYFSDFQMLYDLLGKAKSNAAAPVGTTPLPASPFSTDTAVTQILTQANKSQLDATNNQTAVLSNQLNAIYNALTSGGGGGGGGDNGSGNSALRLLQMNQQQ